METQRGIKMVKDVVKTKSIDLAVTELGVMINIPENTEVQINESGLKKEYFTQSVEVLIGIGKDNTASLIMDIEAFKALKNGELLTFTTCR